MGFVPYGRQSIEKADLDAVAQVLQSDYLTQGVVGQAFEQEAAKLLGAPYALSCNSATSGLHMAYAALGFGVGDILWTVPNTFVATANMALALGGKVDFVDIDPQTFCLCPKALEEKLQQAKQAGCLPKIVVPVHFAGQPCDMRTLRKLADQYSFYLVEDASHAFGARYTDEPVGSCGYSDAAIFSFHPVKIITTGEGGLVTTRNKILAEKMSALRSHGITKNEAEFQNPSDGPWVYEQQSLGFNYRLNDIQAALGLSQMQRIGANIARRCDIAAIYQDQLQGLPLKWQKPIAEGKSSWHLFVVTCDDVSKRLDLFNYLRSNDVGVQVHYIPVYKQPYFRDLGFKPGLCPVAESYYSGCISLPMYHALTQNDQSRVIDLLRNYF